MKPVTVSSTSARYTQDIHIRQFRLIVDEPVAVGGDDSGPKPTELLLASLGSCKAITLKMYAERKGWSLNHVHVELTEASGGNALEGKGRDRPQIQATLHIEGNLTDEQRQRLLVIADKCPIHKMLSASADIHTQLASGIA
ncbi:MULTISPECIES: OsmC family protein [unclassified Leptolyngbya]|uniref:OsmC family protein n=1 Tax=unclassified Leptolyngbya TaxID=2650499 RepID=UPI0016833AF6|nr:MULTISPECIES: OsmC family protein [unclassified Leptolyngbya]MBD1913096.1 OsmC family protein [Leptolyngbya sp. FACHB-8]MBD2155559.1 OsmC family protein [Leptolyngbya sp. FACHB-16]